MDRLNYFELEEFASPDLLGSGSKMSQHLLGMLDKARELAETPFVVTSGFRTVKHNEKVGGSKTSSHLKGFAVDLACSDDRKRERMIYYLIICGFQRIGISKTFIHVDIDPTKHAAIWLY